jgi:hypothetical protein
MAKALPSGPVAPSRRAFFGAFDRDGWTWASIKAFFWLIVAILILGYVPDRAYYFTVNHTLDIGLLVWSPVNFCPAENRSLPCPAPAGAVIPWDPSAPELALPAARTGGSGAQLGTHLLYVGGSDGSAPTTTVYVAPVANGTFGKWTTGPALPEARADAGIAVFNGTAYLVGGNGPDGKPTNTVWTLKPNESGALTAWVPAEGVTLPEARSGAATLAVADGLLVVGGRGPDGAPKATVWKSTSDPQTGKLGAMTEQPALLDPVADAGIALDGDYVWVIGGTNANGPSGGVQRGRFGTPSNAAPAGSAVASQPAAAPGASAAPAAQGILQWAVSNATNLPVARSAPAVFSANGAVYAIGGSDGQPRGELYWAVPDAAGNLPNGWMHLDATDLPKGGLAGTAPVLSGSHVFLLGGSTQGGILTSSFRASLAPQPPFFQLGIAGLTIPALAIPGEIGQQLGYIIAFSAGLGNMAILIAIGWAFAHKAMIRAWWERRKSRRRQAR